MTQQHAYEPSVEGSLREAIGLVERVLGFAVSLCETDEVLSR